MIYKFLQGTEYWVFHRLEEIGSKSGDRLHGLSGKAMHISTETVEYSDDDVEYSRYTPGNDIVITFKLPPNPSPWKYVMFRTRENVNK